MSTPRETDSIALVFDRAHIDAAREVSKGLEDTAVGEHVDGWSAGVRLFGELRDARYLVLIADGLERVLGCMPRVALGYDEEGLELALRAADEYLEGRRAMWIFKCDPLIEEEIRRLLKELTTPVLPGALN